MSTFGKCFDEVKADCEGNVHRRKHLFEIQSSTLQYHGSVKNRRIVTDQDSVTSCANTGEEIYDICKAFA